jgi:hypothetical protein
MVLTLLQLPKIIEAGKHARETVSIIGVIPIIPLDRFLDSRHNLKRANRFDSAANQKNKSAESTIPFAVSLKKVQFV